MRQLDYDQSDYRTKGLNLVLDYLIGFLKYISNSDMPYPYEYMERDAHRFILNICYNWNSSYGGLRVDEVVFANIESLSQQFNDLQDTKFLSWADITGSYLLNNRMYEEQKLYNVYLNINHCIYVVLRMSKQTIYAFQRYIEKDFGINRYVINNLNDVDEALENDETEWLNVFIDYIGNNKLWLETILMKLDDKPQHIELKTKVIRYLNKLNTEKSDIEL